MPDYTELSIDKFIFRVATDRLYDEQGVWVLRDGARASVGLSDFLQQRSGDIAFAEMKPAGTTLLIGDELGSIETIKVNLAIGSPVAGTVAETNPLMDSEPERINLDPYGEGWLVTIDVSDWDGARASLLEPQAFLALMEQQAQEELEA